MLLNARLFMMQTRPQCNSQRDDSIDTVSRFLVALVIRWTLSTLPALCSLFEW
jgi:hypothetical protein